MGDGFRKQVQPRHRLDRVAMARPIIHHSYDDERNDNEWDSKGDNMHFNRYPTISSITLVQKNIVGGGKSRLARLPKMPSPPSVAISSPKYRGYHPYSRPMIAATALTTTSAAAVPSRIRVREPQPTRIAVAKCCCCENPSLVPMLAQMNPVNPLPLQMQWIKPNEARHIENGSDQGPSNIETEIKLNSDEEKPITENHTQTDEPESPKENDEI